MADVKLTARRSHVPSGYELVSKTLVQGRDANLVRLALSLAVLYVPSPSHARPRRARAAWCSRRRSTSASAADAVLSRTLRLWLSSWWPTPSPPRTRLWRGLCRSASPRGWTCPDAVVAGLLCALFVAVVARRCDSALSESCGISWLCAVVPSVVLWRRRHRLGALQALSYPFPVQALCSPLAVLPLSYCHILSLCCRCHVLSLCCRCHILRWPVATQSCLASSMSMIPADGTRRPPG